MNKIIKEYKGILLTLLIVLISIVVIGCTTTSEGNSIGKVDRFVEIANEYHFYVVYDRKTKVQYAVSKGGYNSGNVTLLVDSEGKPLLYEEEY